MCGVAVRGGLLCFGSESAPIKVSEEKNDKRNLFSMLMMAVILISISRIGLLIYVCCFAGIISRWLRFVARDELIVLVRRGFFFLFSA